VLITSVLIECLNRPWGQAPMLAPLLAVPPALAGIGASTIRRPLVYGAISLLATIVIALKPTEYAGWLPPTTIFTVGIITVVATAGTAIHVRQERRIADMISVAEAAQRAVLRPPPPRIGPLGFGVVYLAAAAEAKVGGDLYEAVATVDHGIRVIMGDVRGKGLGAVELAADVLGMFRELAHDPGTLADLATRLDTGLSRDLGRHEEFVTALLVEIDPECGRTTIFNCGHPAPLLIPAADDVAPAPVTFKEVPVPAPPLGLLALGDSSAAQLSFSLQPNDQLLLYTDGVTEARDAKRGFYPLPARVAALSAKTTIPIQAASRAALRLTSAPDGSARQGLLDLIRADLLKHVGSPLDDDAALLLVNAPETWPAARTQPVPVRSAAS
jgi:serine phosphatase RsbU (regulator of sigma subunit)